MNPKQHKIISAILIAIATVAGLQTIVYLANLNEIGLLIHVSFWIWIYLWIKIAVMYDLHFKIPGSFERAKQKHESIEHKFVRFIKIFFSTIIFRVEHLFSLKFFRHYFNYLLLPGFVFWSTVGIIYVNLGHTRIQQVYAWLSSIALVVTFWYLKEVFSRKKLKVDQDIFIALSTVKIYAVTIAYGSGLAIMKHFCLQPDLFTWGVFAVTFLFIHQALFQHDLNRKSTLLSTLLIALAMSVIGFWVYMNWGFNYFTAGIFLAAFYNFFWNTYHYYLDKALTKKLFFELLVITALILYLALINTNFKAQLLSVC